MCLLCDCNKLNQTSYLPPITPAEQRVLEQIREEVEKEEARFREQEALSEKLLLHTLSPDIVLPVNPIVGPSDDFGIKSDIEPTFEDKPVQESLPFQVSDEFLLNHFKYNFEGDSDLLNFSSTRYQFWCNNRFETFD